MFMIYFMFLFLKECSSESDSTQSSEEEFDYKQEDTQLELQEIPKKRFVF